MIVENYQDKKTGSKKKILDRIKLQHEKELDIAEEALQHLIKEKYFPAVKYFLDKKGETRGYGDQYEAISVVESAAIVKAINRKFLNKKI